MAVSEYVQVVVVPPVVTDPVPVAISVAFVPLDPTTNVYLDIVRSTAVPLIVRVHVWLGNAVAVLPESFARTTHPVELEPDGCNKSDVVPICQTSFPVTCSVVTCPAHVSVTAPEVAVQVPMKVCKSLPASAPVELPDPHPTIKMEAAVARHTAIWICVAEDCRTHFASIIGPSKTRRPSDNPRFKGKRCPTHTTNEHRSGAAAAALSTRDIPLPSLPAGRRTIAQRIGRDRAGIPVVCSHLQRRWYIPFMNEDAPLVSQVVVRVCLLLVAAIAMTGGALQMFLGQPDTSPRLDNVHRFMAGGYFSTGLINLWAAITIRQQGFLVYLLALGVLLAGVGRLVSIRRVGLPKPAGVWLGYLIPELGLPFVIALAQHASTAR